MIQWKQRKAGKATDHVLCDGRAELAVVIEWLSGEVTIDSILTDCSQGREIKRGGVPAAKKKAVSMALSMLSRRRAEVVRQEYDLRSRFDALYEFSEPL